MREYGPTIVAYDIFFKIFAFKIFAPVSAAGRQAHRINCRCDYESFRPYRHPSPPLTAFRFSRMIPGPEKS